MSHFAKSIQVSDRHGFTALELIIVLVVGFSIIALSASKMGQLFSASGTAGAMTSLLELYSSARSLRGISGYQGAGGSKAGDLLELLIDANMVPKSLPINGKVVTNEWGGAVAIGITNNGLGFDISYGNVPSEACLKLSQNLIHSGNFASIKAGTTDIKADDPVSKIITACKPAEKAKAVDMTFSFLE